MTFRTLLPFNASAAERAIEQATSEQIAAVDINAIRAVKTARQCPEHLLPWLAWEHAVDYWDESWSQEQKIQTIESAAYVHRHKGTAGAVRRSLAAVGYPTEIVEWWQENPRRAPYTFRVVVYADGEISDGLYKKITNQVNAAKSLRSYLSSIDIQAGFSGQATTYIGSAVTAHADIIISAGVGNG